MADVLTIQVQDALGLTAQAFFTIPFNTTPAITTASPLPNATQSGAYSTTIAAGGGVTPYTWSISSQTGLNTWAINASTGVLSGTPSTVETDTIVVQVLDNVGQPFSKSFSLPVLAAGGSLVVTVDGGLPVPPGTQGVPYEIIVHCTTGTGALSWSKTSGPAYGSITALDATSALFSGTPTGITSDTFVIRVTDSLSNTGTITFTL